MLTFVSVWVFVPVAIIVCNLVAWLVAFLHGRNPLPVPELGARIFAKQSAEVKAAVSHGLVASDLVASATCAAEFLRERGFRAGAHRRESPRQPVTAHLLDEQLGPEVHHSQITLPCVDDRV